MLADKLMQPDPGFDVSRLNEQQKIAYDLYEAGNKLWNKDIGHDLRSEQAHRNVEAMKNWCASAEMGYIKAAATIIANIEEGGFVKDAETNREVPFYGRSMGLNPEGKSGWEIIRHYGQVAIEAGLDDPDSFGNSPMAKEIIYTGLAECYGDDECLGVEPWATDYQRSFEYYCKAGDLNFKTWRYVAEMFWFGHLQPPEGKTVGEISLEYMLKAVQSHDATANFYLGLWYLNDSGRDPVLPVPEGETKYTQAVKYLEEGRRIANHGTIRKTMESLYRLADIYETGEGSPKIPKDLDKALEIYDEMLSERYFPGNKTVMACRERVLARKEAEKTGKVIVLFDKCIFDCDPSAVLKNGEVFIPAGSVTGLGAEVKCGPEDGTVEINNPYYHITAKTDSASPVVNNTEFTIPNPLFEESGIIFVPLAFICEALNYELNWNDSEGTAYITTPDGHHPGEGEVVADRAEELEFAGQKWLILEEKTDRRLIIAKDVIGERAYNPEGKQVTWETSDMRKWLNGEYYSSFSEEDQKEILMTRIANPYNDHFKTIAGNSTADRIFLLSQEEEEIYFHGTGSASLAWWTRTPGIDQRFQVMIAKEGRENHYGWRSNNILGGVRPAMWIRKKEEDPHSHPQMIVSSEGEHTLVISFDRPMNPQAAAFRIEKDGNAQGITSVRWSEDHHTIYVGVMEKLAPGEWKVFMENVRNQRKNQGILNI